MFLIFDTETTGLPKDFSAPISNVQNWPRCIQLAWQLHNSLGELIETKNYIIKPDGFTIPYNSQKIHGISTERAMEEGWPIDLVLEDFSKALSQTNFFVGHNILFDLNIIFSEYFRLNDVYNIEKKSNFHTVQKDNFIWRTLDTMTEKTAQYCKIMGGRSGKFKYPKLTELYIKLFGNAFEEAHNASADVAATARCFFELLRIGEFDNLDEEVITQFRSNYTSQINIFPTIDNIKFEDSNKKLNTVENEPKDITVEQNISSKKDEYLIKKNNLEKLN